MDLLMAKKNIALVTGGYSGEAVISYKSAEAIYKNIDQDKWNCFVIDIHPSGWFHESGSGKKTLLIKMISASLWPAKKYFLMQC